MAMKSLTLDDLVNPEMIQSVLIKNLGHVVREDNQGFQAYYNHRLPNGKKLLSKLELWQLMDDGRLMKVRGWTRKSIISYY